MVKEHAIQVRKYENDGLFSSLFNLTSLSFSASIEPKLPLLYKLFFRLCLNQLSADSGDGDVLDAVKKERQGRVAKHALGFDDVIGRHAGVDGSNWSVLGALGLGSNYSMSPRAKFLATSLVLFVRSTISQEGIFYSKT